MQLYTSILIFHVAVGTVSLLSGSTALLTKKGGKVHRKAGKVYYYGMYAVTISALVMSLLKFNPFLLAIAIFSLYLSYSGIRALKYWRLKETYIPAPSDQVPYYIALVTALFMILYPFAIMIREGGFFVPVLSVFGLLMLPLAWKDIIAHKRPENFTPRNKAWLLNHIGKMSGAYIATFTAFLLNNVTFSPGWVIWLGPTAIGFPLISMAIRKWTKKLNKKTPAVNAAV